MDGHWCKNGWETRQLVIDHVLELRKVPCFAAARLVIVPEANLGNEAQEVSDVLLGSMQNCVVVCDRREDYGIRTNPGTPQLYTRTMGSLLAKNAISFHHECVTANTFVNKTVVERRAILMKDLKQQLRSFRRILVLPKTLMGKALYAYTAQADKDNQRAANIRQDLAMALMFGVFYSDQLANGLVHCKGFEDRLQTGQARRRQGQLAPYIDPWTRTYDLTDQAAQRILKRNRQRRRAARTDEANALARFNRPPPIPAK